MNDLSADIGLLRREVRDVRALANNIDHQTRKLFEPRARRAGGLCARLATIALIASAVICRNAATASGPVTEMTLPERSRLCRGPYRMCWPLALMCRFQR
jgi:hypothetical protein